ncbi:hypothetical protein [Corallococcus silvisoli]|uniref:hypothetical protein n=1 Tax=Corallococcus silvisoli TaxID=2697031 RepID=UPI001377619C|nr:hypothetical protein [Corallococcus silvisoli]NBD09929.1 hypothetical protein [Corallococcus silvisoli]
MTSRALVSLVFCASVFWPLQVLACGNSVDPAEVLFTPVFWVEMVVWIVAAAFFNRVVLVNVQGATAMGQPGLSGFRRTYFVLVGAAVVFLLAAGSTIVPFLNVHGNDIAYCSIRGVVLLSLAVTPVALFALQAAFLHGLGKRRSGGTGLRPTLLGVALSSVVFVGGFGLFREELILPLICRGSNPFVFRASPYD